NRFSPNGGVNMPIAILAVITMPKWIGSMPTDFTSGMNKGVSTRIAEVGSRKHPTIKRTILMAMRNDHGARSSDLSAAVSACGTPLMVRIQENSEADATMTMICAVTSAERDADCSTSLQEMVR